MKKLALFLIFCLLLILLISCGNSTSNTSSVTTQQTSEPTPSISTTQPSSEPSTSVSTTLPTTTKAPITSTSKATETQPISTSETIETDPTVIRVGFSLPSGMISCPLFVAYEMPKSCSLSGETVSITLYFSLHEVFVPDDASEEDYFEIYLRDNDTLFKYPLCNMTIKEARSKNYSRLDSGPLFPSHGETFEIPLSIFSEEQSARWDVVADYHREDNTWYGCNRVFIDYEKINGKTIVFYPHHIAKS